MFQEFDVKHWLWAYWVFIVPSWFFYFYRVATLMLYYRSSAVAWSHIVIVGPV